MVNVRYWHLTDNSIAAAFARYWTKATWRFDRSVSANAQVDRYK